MLQRDNLTKGLLVKARFMVVSNKSVENLEWTGEKSESNNMAVLYPNTCRGSARYYEWNLERTSNSSHALVL